ncbi:MAG: hypothetical protein Q4B26_02320 [Eubacteriales bacterium]|nr:hypothetical protein [Eubacteriales bacterium]
MAWTKRYRKYGVVALLCGSMVLSSLNAVAAVEQDATSEIEILEEEIVDNSEPDLTQRYPFYNNPKKPAPIGIWLKAYRLAYADSNDHEVYFRVTELADPEDTVRDIDAFNAASKTSYIGELLDPNLTYKEILYDVYYPEDYPVGSEGYVVDPTLAFSISNPNGGGFVTERGIYVGLTKVEPITMEDASQGQIKPGMVYHGKAVFAMLNDGTDYVLQYACRQSEPDGEVIYQYSKLEE